MKKLAFLPLLLLGACQDEMEAGPVFQTGKASVYADSLAGEKTASGEPYEPGAPTCAHKKVKLGTWLQVERVGSERVARCRVNDRGPFVAGRVVDLSKGVAEELGVEGLAEVRLRKLEPSD